MGYNSVAVLYNDFSGEFSRDGRIGKRIADAMRGWSMRDRDPLATNFGAGQVVSQAHADNQQVVVVGKNTGKPITDCAAGELDWIAQDEMAAALERHGWFVKPPKKR